MGLPARLVEPVQWDALPTPEERWRAECERRYERMQLLSQDERLLSMDAEYCSRGFRGLCHWLENYTWMLNPDPTKAEYERRVPIVLWDSQRGWLEWLHGRIAGGHAQALTPKTRKLGVTWLTLLACLWFCTFQRSFSALLGSRKEELVDGTGSEATLFGKIRATLRVLPAHVRPVAEVDRHMFMRFSNESWLIGEATNMDFGRSGRVSVVVLDEFAATPNNVAARTWTSIESVAPTVVAIWNPQSEDHITFKLHMGKDGERAKPEAIRFLDWRFAPHRDEAWWEGRLIENGGRLTRDQREHVYGGRYGYDKTGLIFQVDRDAIECDEDTEGFNLELLQSSCYHIGGWDYGAGQSYTANPGGQLDLRNPDCWVLWITQDPVWSRVDWPTVAADATAIMDLHPMGSIQWGDPAGHSTESNQSSWASNLMSAGVPIQTLPPEDNRVAQFDQAIQRIQMWMDYGHIRVHKRCTRLWACLNSWKWNTDPDNPTKALIKPDHGIHSHIGMALLYLSMGLERYLVGMKSQPGKSAQALGLSPMEVIEDALDGSSYRV